LYCFDFIYHLINMHKMDFYTKFSHIIFVIFQMKIKFQRFVFQHNYVCLNEKPFQMLFVKSHERNFSYGIEMV
jgi:hypothetical protein